MDEIINRQNNRHKQHEEQNLKEKEIHQKQLEKRQNMKSSKFCNFCDLYQNNEAHFCSLFQKWIKVDNANLVFLQGASQNDVKPTAKDGKTMSSRIIKAYPNKTSMFNDLKQMKIKIKKELQSPKFKCYLCGESLQSISDLIIHHNRNHKGYPKKMVCEECDHICTHAAMLNNHKETEHNIYICARCNIQFNGKESLEEHKEKQHT